jgi:DNA polymerase alpha subunit A
MPSSTNTPSAFQVAKTKEDDDFLAGLLGEVENNIPAPGPRRSKLEKSGERKRVRVLSPEPAARKKKMVIDRFPSLPPGDVDDDFAPIMDDDAMMASDLPMSDPAPSSPAAKVAERKSQAQAQAKEEAYVKVEEEEEDDMMEVARTGGVVATSVNMSGSRPPKKSLKPEPYPSPASSSPAKAAEVSVDSAAWNSVNDKLNLLSSPDTTRQVGKMDYKDAIEADGSLRMYWTDYTELHGSLYLFGKVLNKKTRAYASCFVKIDNILRKLYFLPRKHRVVGGIETDDEIGMADVYNEVDAIMTRMRVKSFKIKPCARKYAFELPDVPREAEYLKLFYSYKDHPTPLDMNLNGETFSRVFGTNTSLFEQFVLWKNIMGPCWLKITDGSFDALKNASHCKLEVQVDHPKMVDLLPDGDSQDAPPLTLMSLAMRTTFNARENKQEVLGISARIYEKVSITDTTPASQRPCRTFTVIRPNGTAFPIGFAEAIKKRQRGLIKQVKTEKEIFNFFLAQVDIVDPDVFLAHGFEGVDYSILLSRLQENKIHKWSRIGRLGRTLWPGSIGKVGGSVFAERQVMAGRLLCDLSAKAGREVMYKCQSYSLSEMCSKYLPGDNMRKELDNDEALKSWATTPMGFVNYITHMETDTYFIAALALQVQMIPLTKQLTNLAGNSWAGTLTGSKAERNEYILLHEFHRKKYICPDKQPFRGRPKADEEKEDEGQGAKKDKYKGGLVFEPEKGLYDKFVLVMDFNSLYPSIIQEFNICFTTVERASLVSRTLVHPRLGLSTNMFGGRKMRILSPKCPKSRTRVFCPNSLPPLSAVVGR